MSEAIELLQKAEDNVRQIKNELEEKLEERTDNDDFYDDVDRIFELSREISELELDLWQMKSQQLQQQEQKKLLQEIPNKEYQAHIENNK